MIVNFRLLVLRRSFSTSGAGDRSFVVHCNQRITRYGRIGNVVEAERLFNRMPEKSIVTHTAMLTAYAEGGHMDRARKVFDEMPRRNVAAWNAMITAYVRRRNISDVEEAHRLFLNMPERNPLSYTVMMMGFVDASNFDEAGTLYVATPVEWRDPFCSNVLMKGYLKSGRLEEAVRIFEGMKEKNVVSWSSMVDGYCKNGKVTEARELFDAMNVVRNEFTWCSMVDGYMKNGFFDDGLLLFLQMRKETSATKLEPAIVTAILESCGSTFRLKEGRQIHGCALRLGLDRDTYLGNSIIGMYSKFGWIREARKAFDALGNKDVVSWNSLISGYVQLGMVDEAQQLFDEAETKDSVSWTVMLTGFASKGLIDECIRLFDAMTEHDDVAWTALISAILNRGHYGEAVHRFVDMIRKEVVPNSSTLSCMLCAAAGLVSLRLGQQLHAVVCKLRMESDLSVQNSLVSMYSKNGAVDEARRIFLRISAPNIVSYNAMIAGFGRNGRGEEAVDLFSQLRHPPNEVTFLGVLSACAHAGLVEEGRRYFESMKSSAFGVEANADHYAAMVDLLGKAGLLEEAAELIRTMPVEPHSGVWGALLGAAGMHSNRDLAELAAARILELEPDNAVAAFAVKRYRDVMKGQPGCSWIDSVENRTSFRRQHTEGERVYSNSIQVKEK
ncbi:hypothetical protein M569_02541 [Genlisea aurea]|uniref:Pentatricopeptide repeat-containing protein n=1 Tax=Genlisea aurea TaxID=192259 RepID=S8CXK9_9LAMI|nr:hypothetical protein M569_02541 [Genlisea aurea]